MHLPLDLLLKLSWRITVWLVYVKFVFSTQEFYKRVPGFATDCSCGVWCRWSSTWLLYVSSFIGNLVLNHYTDVIMGAMASQITSLTIVYSTVYSGADERNHQRSASLAFVWGIHRWPVNSRHKGPVTRKMFPFDDVIMTWQHFRISAVNFARLRLNVVFTMEIKPFK